MSQKCEQFAVLNGPIDIGLLMAQVSCSRAEASAALKVTNIDIVEDIMQFAPSDSRSVKCPHHGTGSLHGKRPKVCFDETFLPARDISDESIAPCSVADGYIGDRASYDVRVCADMSRPCKQIQQSSERSK